MGSRTVDLVHLVWVPLGLGPFRRFADALLANPPGLPVRLTMIYSGFWSPGELSPYRRHLLDTGLECNEILLPGPGWDIGSYRAAAVRLDGEWICFLNSWSRPLVPGWLDQLLAPQFRSASLGLTGAGGNLISAFWHIQPEAVKGFSRIPPRGWLQRRRYRRLIDWQLRAFPPNPGPIIRTNAFALRRAHFVGLRFPRIRAKKDTYEFESGWVSMSRQVLGGGQQVSVVGRDGVAYPPSAWPASRTFFSGEQDNLVVADNKTDLYAQADPDRRACLHDSVYRFPPFDHYEPYPRCFQTFDPEYVPWALARTVT